jgi:HlyD family secretion protein
MNHYFQPAACIISIGLLLGGCGKKTEETKPIRKDVMETIFAPGILEADDSYQLTARTDGYLQQVLFREGDNISPGQLLAVIDNKESVVNADNAEALLTIARANTQASAPALQQAQTNINMAQQKMELDKVQLDRYEKLLAGNSIARSEYDNIALQYKQSKESYENARQNYQQLQRQASQQLVSNNTQQRVARLAATYNQLRAIVGGKVYQKLKQAGDYVRKGDVIAQIGSSRFIYAKINVDESNIGRIQPGQEAVIQLNTRKEKTYKASVAEIYPSFDEATQSFLCKLVFTDTLDFRITGTQLQANITVGVQKNALLIPRNYLNPGGTVTVKGQKEPVKVQTGFVSNEWVHVLAGITENTVLVTDNIAVNIMETSETGAQLRR